MKMTCTHHAFPKFVKAKTTGILLKRNLQRVLLMVGLIIFSCLSSIGQISITSTGTAFTQNFDGMLGTSATATLTTNQWRVGDNAMGTTWTGATRTATTQLGGTAAAVSSGGIYNYGNGTAATATDRALGFLSSGTAPFTASSTTPLNIYAQYVNNTGSVLGQISGSFDVEKYRNGTNAAGFSINFYYSLNGTAWVNIPAANQAYATDANNLAVAPAATSSKTFSVTGLSIATSATFYLRWSYATTTGTTATNAQGLAIDNVSLTAATSILAPSVTTTTPATSISTTAATFGGNITSNGGATVTASGVVWSVTATNNNPLLSGTGVTNEATSPVTTTGSFTSTTSTTLSPNVQYSFKAYASNSQGPGYGSVATFYTLANTPNTPSVTNPSSNSIDIALLTGDGNPSVTEYNINETTTGLFLQADGTLGATAVWQDAATWASTTTVFGLSANTTYTFKVRARNGAGTATSYSGTASETTLSTPDPTATLSASPSLTEANLNGATFTITLTNDNFSNFTSNPTSLPAGSFTLNNAGGATIASVVATSATTAVVTLAFSGDFDATITNFNVDIDGAQLASASLLTSSNLTITALVETISVTGLIGDLGSICTGSFSAASSYTVGGTDLRNDIIVTAPAGFQISLSNSPFASASPIHLVPVSNIVGSTTIYVRFAPSVTGTTGNLDISVESTGATTQNTVVSGTGVNTPPAITTPTSTLVTATTATLGGNITSIGCASVTERGIYWSTTNGFADGSGIKVSETGTFTTGVFTINVPGLPGGTVIYFKAFALNSIGTAYTVQASFTTTKAEPSNHVTAFACGTTTAVSIPLTWADAAGSVTPDGYLIKWSTVDFASVTAPADGSTINGVNSTTISQGVQSASIAGLSSNTTYFFKIYPYTNSGSSIDYKTDGSIQQTTCTTQLAACYTSSGASINWNFTALTAVASTTTTNVTVSDFSSGNNNTAPASFINATSASTTYTGASGGGNAGAAVFTGAFNSATSTYFAFTITPASGYAVSVSGLNFGARSTGTGPASYSIRSSFDNYATDLATGTMITTSTWQLKANSLTLAGTPGTAITFRIYGFGGTGNAATGTANWRIDDIALSLVVSNAPSAATVGATQNACGSLTTASLGGNTPAVGTGTWSQVSGPGTSTFSAINSGSSTATATVAGTYVYRWSISSGCATINTADITVNYLATTVITTDAAPSSQTVLVNDPSPANLTVTATGAGLTYQWFSNGSNSNAGGTTVGAANGGQTNTFTPPTNVLGTKYYYAVVTGTCGTVTSSAVAVTITNTNTWKAGNATTNWSLAANWTGNAVPTGANDAAIPVGNTPYPALTASVSVNNLVIDPTATVSLNGFTLTINGAVTGTGTLSGSATSAVVTNASTGLLFTPGANTLKDLTVSAGTTTLSNALNITGGTAANTYGTVTVAPGATLASGGNLTIKSNQFGTARVAAGDVAGNYITGDVTVERYIPQNSKRAWRLLSVPTKGTKTIKQTWQENQAAGANGTPGFGTIITSNIATAAPLQAAGFDAYSQLPSMQSYNSATQGWVYVTSTNAAPIQSNKGYFLYIRGDRSVTTSSSTDAASATTLRTTGTLYQGNSNPAVSIAAGKFEPVGNTFASAIDFTSLSKTGGISNTFYVWDSKLLSGTTLGAYQTFNGSIGYTPATPGGSYPAGVPNTSIESGEAFMLGATGTAGTVTLVEASKTAGNQFTPFRPAALPAQFKTGLLKVTGSTTVLADNNIVVFDNAYKNAVDADDALKIQKAGETMSIVTDGKALIIDARQPVSSTDVISFNISNLQPQAYKLSFSTQNMNTAGLTAFVEDKYLHTSTAINLDGVSDYGFTADAANAASSAPDRFRVVFKKAGAMAIAATKAGFSISPNPVEGGVVNVQFKNQLAGKYSIRLLDAGGAVIFSTFATHGGGSSTQVLGLPGGVARGAYQLEITSPSKERELQTLFINSIK